MEDDDVTALFAHLRGRVIAQGLILRAILGAFQIDFHQSVVEVMEQFEPTIPVEGLIELGPGLSEIFLEGYRAEVSQFRQWLNDMVDDLDTTV